MATWASFRTRCQRLAHASSKEPGWSSRVSYSKRRTAPAQSESSHSPRKGVPLAADNHTATTSIYGSTGALKPKNGSTGQVPDTDEYAARAAAAVIRVLEEHHAVVHPELEASPPACSPTSFPGSTAPFLPGPVAPQHQRRTPNGPAHFFMLRCRSRSRGVRFRGFASTHLMTAIVTRKRSVLMTSSTGARAPAIPAATSARTPEHRPPRP